LRNPQGRRLHGRYWLDLEGRAHGFGHVPAISKAAILADPAGALPYPGVVNPYDVLICPVDGKACAQPVSALILDAHNFLGDNNAGQQNAVGVINLVAQQRDASNGLRRVLVSDG
jgi:hypothetical protein